MGLRPPTRTPAGVQKLWFGPPSGALLSLAAVPGRPPGDFQNDCLAAFLAPQRPRAEEKRVRALVKAFKLQGVEVELDVPLFAHGGRGE